MIKKLFFIALLGLAACSNQSDKSDKSDSSDKSELSGLSAESAESHSTIELSERQLKTVGITLGTLEERNLGASVRANGELRLHPQDRASVVPLASGVVRKILVVEGQRVRRGQVVAYIENTDIVSLQRDRLTAERELAYARQELERQQQLQRERAGVAKNLQQARANVEVCEAHLTGLQAQLRQLGVDSHGTALQKQLAVTAPIGGTVTSIAANTGSYADAQSPIMEIANNAAVYASLNIFEKDLNRITTGQHVDIALTYQQDTHISGTVSAVGRTIDTATRATTVSVRLDGTQTASRRLGQGMTVTAMISTDRQQQKALPDDAIVKQGGRSYVYALDHKAKEDGQLMYHFRAVEVVTGESELGHTPITFPQQPAAGTLFVRSGAFYIASASSDHGEHTH